MSGGTFQRDGFDEILALLDRQKKRLEKLEKDKKKHHNNGSAAAFPANEPLITHFVCMDNSRISRNDNMAETLLITDRIRKAGAEIVYVLYPVDYNTSA